MSDNGKQLRSSAKSTALLMVATLASRLLGFVRIGVISYVFGAGTRTDVINSVFNVPNNLRKLLAEGALSTAFVPVLTKNLLKDPSRNSSKKLVSSLFGLQLLVLLPLLIVSALFPDSVSSFFVHFDDVETQAMAAELFRYVIHYILFISFSAVMMGTLNSNDRFIIPGLTPLMFSVCVISSLLLFSGRLGIFSIAVGVLSGGIAQVLFQLPQFIRTGYRFTFTFHFSDPDFRQILRNWGPVLLTSGVFAINQFIANRFATELAVASATAMTNALTFWQLPYGIFSASIVTVLYPRISRQIGQDQRLEAAKSMEFGVSALITFLLPSTIALMIMGPELISAAIQRGNFTGEDTLFAAQVLFWYAPGLVFVGINNFLQRVCFSDGDIRLPVINATIITVLDIGLSLWLKETELQVRGLAVANSISYFIASIWLIIKAGRRFSSFSLKPIFIDFLKVCLAIIPTAAVMLGGRLIFGNYWVQGSSAMSFLKFFAVAIPAIAVLLLLLVAFKLKGVYLLLKRRNN